MQAGGDPPVVAASDANTRTHTPAVEFQEFEQWVAEGVAKQQAQLRGLDRQLSSPDARPKQRCGVTFCAQTEVRLYDPSESRCTSGKTSARSSTGRHQRSSTGGHPCSGGKQRSVSRSSTTRTNVSHQRTTASRSPPRTTANHQRTTASRSPPNAIIGHSPPPTTANHSPSHSPYGTNDLEAQIANLEAKRAEIACIATRIRFQRAELLGCAPDRELRGRYERSARRVNGDAAIPAGIQAAVDILSSPLPTHRTPAHQSALRSPP